VRLFVAHRLEQAPSTRVAEIVASVRSRLPRAAWVGARSYHLTFAFLGEQRPDVVPVLIDALSRAVSSVGVVEARLARGGFFPNEQRARVGWIAIEPHGAVEAIAVPLREAVASCGLSFDAKPFKAHLTLARIRDSWKRSDTEELRRAVDAAGEIPFLLDRVSLFESRLLPAGAVHEELAAFPLRMSGAGVSR
jgi:2'-5' RNA ligase